MSAVLPRARSVHARPGARTRLILSDNRIGAFILAVACLGLGALLKWPEAMLPPASDTGMFAAYGTLLLHGARPYVDFWDLHPPLVFAYWALVDAIAGSDWLRACGPPAVLPQQSCMALAAHAFDLLLSVAAALACSAIIRKTGGSRLAAVLAALLVVGFGDQAMLSQEGSNPSKLTLVPSTLAVLAYLTSLQDNGRARRYALIGGISAAVAILAKQPAVLTLVALAAHATWRRDWPRLGALILGAASLLAIACAVLAAFGSLEGFVSQAWIYNVQRVFAGYFVQPPKAPTVGLARVLAESAGVLAAVGVAGGVLLAATRRDARQQVLVCWAVVNILAIAAFREFVYVVPSLAVLGALGLECIWQYPFGGGRWLMRSALLAASAAGVLLTTPFQRAEFSRAHFERTPAGAPTRTEQLGRVLRTLPDGPLFVYGNGAEMYVLANRAPATRYLNAEALRQSAPGVQAARAELAVALGSYPPPVVILAPHSEEAELNLTGYPALQAVLDACYAREPVTTAVDPSWNILVRTAGCGER